MNEFLLYTRYLRMNYLGGLQYKGWPMVMLSVVISLVTDPVAVLLLFSRFGSIGEWTIERVMLVYGMALASFGLAELFARGYDYFPRHIRTGSFDRILLRPRSTVVQVLGMEFHLHRISKVVAGLAVITWSLARLQVRLTLIKLLQLLAALIGGCMVYAGVFVISSAIAFWTVNALNWTWLVTNGSYQVAKCPPHLLPAWLRRIFTFLMPMLLFAYYPAAAVANWGIPFVWGWLALPAGAAFLFAALCLWRVGVKSYSSTGS